MAWRDERGAGRALTYTIGGLVVVVVLLLIGNLIVRPSGGGGSGRVAQQFTVTAGPEAGTAIPSYVAGRRTALTQLATAGWATVSFTGYHTVTESRALVGSAPLGAFLVAGPGGFPSTIAPSDDAVKQWVSDTKSQAASDAAGLRQMLPTAGDPQTAAEFRADLDRLAVLAKVDGSGPVVFGVVVDGPADALRQLAANPAVRLVDPIGAALPDRAGIAGLRPEETDVTRTPATRPTG